MIWYTAYMNKKILTLIVIILALGLMGGVFAKYKNQPTPEEVIVVPEDDENYACTMDAKMCPDGSYVGRTGKDCHFEECPEASATSATITTSLGQEKTALNVTLLPKEIVSDSRCPIDVTCIWAGTIEVKTTMSTKVAHGEHILKLGEPKTFGDYEITLTEVTPSPNTRVENPDAVYKFTYKVLKK